MKINKLMLTLAVAASAFAACNKQETTPVVNEIGNKSIVLNIANVVTPTKAAGTEATVGKNQVVLNNYQIFFVDGNGKFYNPKDATASNATVPTYFTVNEGDDLTHQFHFLDNNVTRVIVVGNKGADFAPANEDDLWDALANVQIADQQEQNALILYGSDSSLEETDDHYISEDAAEGVTGTDQHPSPVYKAVITLKPAVARFEIVGYEYAQVMKDGVAQPREYASVTVENQSLIGYYDSASFTSEGEEDWTVTPGAITRQNQTYTWDNVYQEYFLNEAALDKTKWYFDTVSEVVLTNAAPVKALATLDEKTAIYAGNAYAYHVYPSTVEEKANVVPSFIFQISGSDGTITTPMYLQTKSFTGLSAIEAGNVYQMNVKFDDSVLKAAEKCIDVEISVHEWVVTVVTPNFK